MIERSDKRVYMHKKIKNKRLFKNKLQEKKKNLPEKSMPVRAVMSMGTANVHRVTWVPLRSQ